MRRQAALRVRTAYLLAKLRQLDGEGECDDEQDAYTDDEYAAAGGNLLHYASEFSVTLNAGKLGLVQSRCRF